ncbi:hypothetical protein BO71DRAFT_367260 [Aspergillus ellipticus CBS 707.79]|uniref:Fungal STAND N-terminal Goodbye domain-containing protein n=1 Tax=Aspergillus ellipticus CBS 707.79 TaxID=1448320 RepID=A0A319CS18_9EURO|nr:hypothetical protein BO71DRAFT_367260 [Aspergillus ellipticus CBS 707.79]
MAVETYTTTATATTPTDLATLWQTAVVDYEHRTGKSLRVGSYRSMDEAVRGTEGLAQKFKDFRNDATKIAKVRVALKNNMWLIQKIVTTVQTVGTSVSAFPPAVPASLIFSAFGQVMQSFADQSADYDKIMGFFEFAHRFLDRLSIIEDKSPNLPPFQRCVTRVFASILRICAVAQKYAAEKRLRKWFENLVKGEDGDLVSANTELEEAVNELSQAVGLGTLRMVDVLRQMTESMDGKMDFLVSKTDLIDERTRRIETNGEFMIKQNSALGDKQEAMTAMQRQTLEMVTEQSQQFKKVVESFGAIQLGANFGASLRASVLKLDVIRLRLSRWGKSVGLADFHAVGSLRESPTTTLDPEELPAVEGLLGEILEQFDDAVRMSGRFRTRHGDGAVLDPARELDPASASLHQKITDLTVARHGGGAGTGDKAPAVTLYEAKSFTRLVEDTGECVNKLVDMYPGSRDAQRKLAEQEVAQVRKIQGALPLLKEAAAGQDGMLMETVVKAIKATSTTTNYTTNASFSGSNSGFQLGSNMGSMSDFRWGK